MRRFFSRVARSGATVTERESAAAPYRPLPPGWAPGQRVLDGDFVVENVLGTGGFGVVYLVTMSPRGRDNRPYVVSGMQYAAKRVRVPGKRVKDQVMAEIQHWRELPVHPNVIPYRFFREVDDEVIVFSEYASRGSMADAIARGDIADLRAALDSAVQAARGLAVLHQCGLVHQDVKPQNLLVREDGSVGLADFGLAGAVARVEGAHRAVGAAATRGRTPAYAAPEHYDDRVGAGADVWSWGICVLELFDGVPMSEPGPQASQALARRLRDGPPSSTAIPLPQGVAALLRRCFEPDPSGRWQDMREVAEALIEIYEATGHAYPRPEPLTAPSPAGDEPPSDERWFKARSRALDAWGAWVEAMDEATDAQDDELLLGLDRLQDAFPRDLAAINPDRGQTARARSFNALRLLRDTREFLAGLVILGYQGDVVDQLLDVTADLVDEYVRHGDHFGARALAAECTALVTEHLGRGRTDLLPVVLASMRREAALLEEMGDSAGALVKLDHGRSFIEPMLTDEASIAPSLRGDVVTDLFIIFCEHGLTCTGSERHEDALHALEHAFAFVDAVRERWSVEPDPQLIGWGMVQLANALDHADRTAEAIAAYDDAIALLENTGGSGDHLSSAHLNKGVAHMGIRDFAAAERSVRRAVQMREAARYSRDWRQRHELAFAQLTLSRALRGRGAFPEAEAAAEDALEFWRRLVEEEGHVQLGQYQYMAIMEVGMAGAELGVHD